MPPWMTSSAPQEASTHAQAVGRLGAQPLGQRHQHRHRGEVVVGARARSGCGRCPRTPRCASAEPASPAAMSPRRPRSDPSATSAGAAQQRPPQRQRGVEPLESPGKVSPEPAWKRVVEDLAGGGGVVVGEHDEGARRIGVADVADDVPGRPRRAGGAAEQPRPVGDVVGDGGQPTAPATAPATGRRAPAGQRGHPGQAAGDRQRAHHAGVAVAEPLLLDLAPRSRPRAAAARSSPPPVARRLTRRGARAAPASRSPRAAWSRRRRAGHPDRLRAPRHAPPRSRRSRPAPGRRRCTSSPGRSARRGGAARAAAWPGCARRWRRSGGPSEIPEPLTLRRSIPSGSSQLRRTASTWAAKASLSSIRSMSSMVSPARASALAVAGTGPMPIVLRRHAGDRPADQPRHRRQAQLGGLLGVGDDADRRAVVLTAGVAGGDGGLGVLARPSPGAARRGSPAWRRRAGARRGRSTACPSCAP